MKSPWASPNDPRIYETPFGPMQHPDGDDDPFEEEYEFDHSYDEFKDGYDQRF